MKTVRKSIVITFLGTEKDAGADRDRWNRWRPTVGLCGHAQFPVDRIELFLTGDDHRPLAEQVTADIAKISPDTAVAIHVMPLANPWDFQTTYAALHEFAKGYAFSGSCDYYAHLATGTHTAQICLFLLTESRHIPAKLLETRVVEGPEAAGRKKTSDAWRGRIEIIDLNLTTYDLLASRFRKERVSSQTLLKSGIPTRNKAFNALITDIEKVCMR